MILSPRALPLLVAAILLAACQAGPGPAVSDGHTSRRVLVAAHRGCVDGVPENSLPAIVNCASADVDIVETDVRVARDGALVIMHDETVGRMTDGAGDVRSLSGAEIAALKLRQGYGGAGASLTDLSPPTLSEVLASMPPGLMINLDVKDAAAYPGVSAMLRETSAGPAVILKSSMSPDNPKFGEFVRLGGARFMPVIRQCLDGQTSAPDLYCVHEPSEILRDFDAVDVFGYELIFRDEAFLEAFSHLVAGRDVEVWVNLLAPEQAAGRTDALALGDPDAHWGRIVDLGATILQTDYPEELRAYLDRRTAGKTDQP